MRLKMSDAEGRTPPKENDPNDPLSGLDAHLRPPKEGAKAAGVELEDKPGDDDLDDLDIETETEDEETPEDIRPKYEHLKSEVGRQANEIGELRKKLNSLAPPAPTQTVNRVEERIKAMRDKWGNDLTESILELVSIQTEPLRQTAGVLELKERYPDLNEVKDDMEEILSKSQALRDAAMKDNAVLDTVYVAAKAKRVVQISDEQKQKEEARSRKVSEMRADLHVERPTPKANTPKKVTPKEWAGGFVDHLIKLPPNA